MFGGQVSIEHCIDTGSNSSCIPVHVHVDALLTSINGIWLLYC